ncbi:FAD-dependent oxidoreductase [Microlunatus capsulatus]|uniref:2-polyprenyl-6-methoxyphenol hydroxylase-like FAD-dependent oxidoreductase n=1 Tax=Microlunatus capsulatus TaxID=99117 RepID=A0ABS4ZDA1_9ACTN|nr:NAD(P)-binding protein [Microlunatus capsulatus]MBP2418153.1 2-polyprenyl-6-methoxyphenol hydroxylase-like FAD-dependent oxidoreductase [Microlunatus capsulatus]
MRVGIIGAGPTGLFLAGGLARRGHAVTVVDRDTGPGADGRWPRRGVMQFHHAHAFRAPCRTALEAELPGAAARWDEAGAEPTFVTLPDGSRRLMTVLSRRETFETALRAAALAEPGVDFRPGHVDAVLVEDGRAAGLAVDGTTVAADLVLDAAGRSGRATAAVRPAPTAGGDCGIAYVDRQYQLRPGAGPGPLTNPMAWQADLDGYQVILFPHERGIFSVVLLRPTATRALLGLRHAAAFEAACRAVPGLDTWTDPERSRPLTDVLPGGRLFNHYRPQTHPDGRLALPGLVLVGDAVGTTTPNFGRGVTLSLLQAQQLLALVDEHGRDVDALGHAFDAWCDARVRPWVEDHAVMDDGLRRRWRGEDVDLDGPLPSDLVMAAAAVDPAIGAAVGPYAAMLAGPEVLDPVRERARAVYASGWRPAFDEGPDAAELAAVVAGALT